MDRNLEKYRFGITLKLEESVYYVYCKAHPSEFFQTTCEWLIAYLKATTPTLTQVERNIWMIPLHPKYIQAVQDVKDFWISTDNICKPIPV